MKLKLGLVGAGERVVDLVITVEPTVPIGDLAAVLARRDRELAKQSRPDL